ncbi:MAG: hypothetical protein MR839_06150 [Spirochaetia bacterium]|nr:hypothetical protein [Spirochaetia bacterium]
MKILQLEWKINFNIGGFNEKNFLVIAILMVAAVELSASDVSDLLDKAKEAYISGDKITAIQNIDEAKKKSLNRKN